MKKKLLEALHIHPYLIESCFHLSTQQFDEYLFWASSIGYDTDEARSYQYPHKPFLVPILLNRDWPCTLCMGVHFFSERPPYYAIRYYDNSFETAEIAFSFEQLMAYHAIKSIENDLFNDIGGLGTWLKRYGLNFFDAIDNLTNEYGVFTEEAYHLSFFCENLPIESSPSSALYKGSAFANDKFYIPENLEKICTYEVRNIEFYNAMRQELKDKFPLLLTPKANQQELFDRYYNEDDLNNAWLSLNSYGWGLKDSVAALKKLQEKTEDRQFHFLADHWISEAQSSKFFLEDGFIF